MKPFLGAESLIKVGVPVVIETDAPDGSKGVVFEDDGTTGYFYARDYQFPEQLFVDALHIYNVAGVRDRDRASKVKILWTRDFQTAALLINQRPYAVFHFGRRCGYAASPFPEPDPKTGWAHGKLDESFRDLFFPSGSSEQTGCSEPRDDI